MQPQTRPRAFLFQSVRSGPAIRFHTTVSCSTCPREKVFESARKLPDEVVSKKFREWGWLMGRNRAYDICPGCLRVGPENRLAGKFPVTRDGQPVPTCAEVVDLAARKRDDGKAKVFAAIDRHLFKPEPPPATASAPAETSQQPTAPAQNGIPAKEETMPDRIDQLVKMVGETQAELKDARAAQDLILESNVQLAEALTRLIDSNRTIRAEHAAITSRLDSLAGYLNKRSDAFGLGLQTVIQLLAMAGTPPQAIEKLTQSIPQPPALVTEGMSPIPSIADDLELGMGITAREQRPKTQCARQPQAPVGGDAMGPAPEPDLKIDAASARKATPKQPAGGDAEKPKLRRAKVKPKTEAEQGDATSAADGRRPRPRRRLSFQG